MVWRQMLGTLRRGPATVPAGPVDEDTTRMLAERLAAASQARLGRSLCIRQVDCGSCNGCELEIRMLDSIVYDLERFGLRFVPSPRHADVLLVTGAGTPGMAGPLHATYEGMPDPRVVIAIGADAASGGLLGDRITGVDGPVPVDVWVPGSPPSPFGMLNALLIATGKLASGGAKEARR
jgi:Ni,Fe-hydrogenase III small subunit